MPGDVVVIRYEGPKGGPGMREMLNPTSALAGMELDYHRGPHHRRPFLRRHPAARPSATSAPKLLPVGLSVWSRKATPSRSTSRMRPIHLAVSDEELAARKAAYVQPEPNIKTGWLARYARLVTSANLGAVLK